MEHGIELAKADEGMIGSRGLKNMGGVIGEEYQKELRTLRQRVAMWAEMTNDPYLGSALLVLETLLAGIEYRIQPQKGMEEDERAKAEALFVSECLRDMETSWEDLMSEILTMLPNGFAAMERSFKIREDGQIGWADIALRPAETIWEWVYDGDRLVAVQQQLTATQIANPNPTIPIENIYLFRTKAIKNNPEGHSLLRRAYIPYIREKRHRDLEAIGHEKDATGTPKVSVPREIMQAKPGSEEEERKNAAKKIATRLKQGTETGLVLSSERYEDSKERKYDVELLKSPGERQFDAGPMIERCNREKLLATGTDIILLGHEKTGAISEGNTGAEKRDILNAGLNAIAERIADVFNRRAIPELCDFRGVPKEYRPEMKPQRLQREISLKDFTAAIVDLAGVGHEVDDDATQNEARGRLRLPLREGAEEV